MARFANEPTSFVSISRQQRAKEKEGTQVFISAFAAPPSGNESSYGSGGPTKDSIKFAAGLQDEKEVDEEGALDFDLKKVRDMNDPYYNEQVIGAKRAKKSRKIMAWAADRLAQHSEEHTKMVDNGPFAMANGFGVCWRADAQWAVALRGAAIKFADEKPQMCEMYIVKARKRTLMLL
jgi:hypothetical protein